MIFSTFNQVNCFLIFLFFGIIIGLISKLFFTLILKNYQKIIIKNIFYTVFYTFFSIFFVFLINYYNLGQFNYALIISYLLGYFYFLYISKNLFAFLENKWYNMIIKFKPFRNKKNESNKEN